MHEFDSPPDRRGSASYKLDDNEKMFGRADLMPFWVADMDFATPQPILDAISQPRDGTWCKGAIDEVAKPAVFRIVCLDHAFGKCGD